MGGGHATQRGSCLFAQTGARRIEDYEIECQLRSAFGEESFGCRADAFHVVGHVVPKVGERVRRRFHGQHLIEVAGQALGKQAGAGVKVESGASGAVGHGDFDQLVDEKAVGLKEGAGADPVVGSHSVVHEKIVRRWPAIFPNEPM